MPFTSAVVLLFGIASIVANLISLDKDTNIATWLMYMMSIHNVTFQYCLKMLAGIAVTGKSIMGDFFGLFFLSEIQCQA